MSDNQIITSKKVAHNTFFNMLTLVTSSAIGFFMIRFFLGQLGENDDVVKNLEVAEVVIKTKKSVAIKNFNDIQELRRFVLVHDENICAGGIIATRD